VPHGTIHLIGQGSALGSFDSDQEHAPSFVVEAEGGVCGHTRGSGHHDSLSLKTHVWAV
jgi:hypothetical protein